MNSLDIFSALAPRMSLENGSKIPWKTIPRFYFSKIFRKFLLKFLLAYIQNILSRTLLKNISRIHSELLFMDLFRHFFFWGFLRISWIDWLQKLFNKFIQKFLQSFLKQIFQKSLQRFVRKIILKFFSEGSC